MAQQVYECGDPYAITNASTTVPATDAVILGILVSTSTSGTLTITDRATARTICSVMPLTAGQYIPIKARSIGALALTGGGTFAATLMLA